MSAPLEDVTANNNAVFESASGSPAVANSIAASPVSPNVNNSIAASPVSPNVNNTPAVANSIAASELSNMNSQNSPQNFTAIVPNVASTSTASTSTASTSTTPTSTIAAATVTPSNIVYQPKRTRSQLQMEHDARAKEFRARVNPAYIGMFSNIPQKLRPKGFPAAAARQAIELDPDEQKAFVKNIADERRNAIEVKLGKKTRRVNPSSLKDIESILKMSEQSLVRKYPSDKALIRMFGRETRRVARDYTSEHINTLVSPSRNVTRKATTTRNNAVHKSAPKTARNKPLSEIELKNYSNNNSLKSEVEVKNYLNRNTSPRRNVNPPAYNE